MEGVAAGIARRVRVLVGFARAFQIFAQFDYQPLVGRHGDKVNFVFDCQFGSGLTVSLHKFNELKTVTPGYLETKTVVAF